MPTAGAVLTPHALCASLFRGVEAVHPGPLVLDPHHGAEQLAATEAGKLVLGQAKSVLPGEELVDLIGAPGGR
ncbi:hypothetical protein [Mycobacterium sp. 852014-52144_SCH5372336]|uniref:hypothetical protein n=1 Tax=Mycobacterium sp. 852014-52144_SCH5372336 TaxID=1834115 RepID=UPI0007FFECB1|nr:hypothetical protein [Mycobacterium sp. 852014-52144_SCH5372336]OBB72121.1 hypothetical protein A5759_19235 [Mycobacterium sp. 852014-52144_SCH5372336]